MPFWDLPTPGEKPPKLDPFGAGSLMDSWFGPSGSRLSKIKPAPINNKNSEVIDKLLKRGKYAPEAQQQGISQADIFARLEAMQDPSRYYQDPESLRNQARAMASEKYGPIIAALRNQMSSAQTRGERGRQQIGDMYSSLSQSYESDIPRIQEQFEGTKKNTQQEYDELQGMIKDQYASSQADQEAMLQRLGIQAAASETLPAQNKDRDYYLANAAENAQTQQSAIGQEQTGAVDFTRRGGRIAQYEGTGRQADLMFQLQELLANLEGKIGENTAAMESASTSNYGQLQSQMQESAQKRAQQDFTNLLSQIQLGRDFRSDEFKYNKGITAVKSPSDVAGRMLSMGLDPASAQRVQSTFMNAVGSDPNILAGIDNTFGNALPKEALAARIVEAGRQQGLSAREINALQVAALEYFGRV